MDSGISTVRNLLIVVLVLVLLSILTNIYVGNQLAQNSAELHNLGHLMQNQVQNSVVEQSQQLQAKMDKLDQDAAGFDQKMDEANKKFFKDLNDQLPIILDKYVKSRAPQIERQAMKQVPH
jgi:peptidoglycan hydrolase CwlO-like protein